jgi:hypothetical protein
VLKTSTSTRVIRGGPPDAQGPKCTLSLPTCLVSLPSALGTPVLTKSNATTVGPSNCRHRMGFLVNKPCAEHETCPILPMIALLMVLSVLVFWCSRSRAQGSRLMTDTTTKPNQTKPNQTAQQALEDKKTIHPSKSAESKLSLVDLELHCLSPD